MNTSYHDSDDNLVMLTEDIKRDLFYSQPCEICYVELTNHLWIALDENGMVIKCSNTDKEPPKPKSYNSDLSFTEYASYDPFGQITKQMARFELEQALRRFESEGYKFQGIWELRAVHGGGDQFLSIEVRISPAFTIDGVDDNWRHPQYTFIPKV